MLFRLHLRGLFFDPFSLTRPATICFFFIEAALIHNFTDNNTLSALAQSVLDLVSKVPSNVFQLNKMIINREKFQAILLNKRKSDLPNLYLNVDYKAIKSR